MSKRICNVHGLWDKINAKDRCPKCHSRSTRLYDKQYRNKEADKFYHSRPWKRVRAMQLKRYPLCVECSLPARIADHIVEIKDGGDKLSLSNLQSMCNPCHNIKTAQEKAYRGGVVKSLQVCDTTTEPPIISLDKPFSGSTP